MTKTRITTLAKMEEPELRTWTRKIWAIEYPEQVSAWYDQWETRMWAHVAFKKDDTCTIQQAEYFKVRDLSRKITCTILGQPPYQAIKP